MSLRGARARLRVVVAGGACLAVGVAGCGGSSQGRSAVVTRQVPAPPGATTSGQSAPTATVLHEINVVCTAILQGSPRPLRAPLTPSSVAAFANAAQPYAQRVVVSLQRLASHGDAQALATLGRSWQQLQSLYVAARASVRNAGAEIGVGRQMLQRQMELQALALSDRLPACAVIA